MLSILARIGATRLLLGMSMFQLYLNNLTVMAILIAICAILVVIRRKIGSWKVTGIASAGFVAFILLTASWVLTHEEMGGDPGAYEADHYPDDQFHNLNETVMSTGTVTETLIDYMTSYPRRTPNSVIPTAPYQELMVEGDEISITWFGHSSVLFQTNEITILADPLIENQAMGPLFFGPAPFDYEHTYSVNDLPAIDYVLISHDHYDHLDMDSVKKLKDSHFFVPLGVETHLIEWGISEDNIDTYDWWQNSTIEPNFNLSLVPTQHFSGRGLTNYNTLWGSWVIELNDQMIYFSGDSGYSAEFEAIGDMYGPFDIAFLEAGQYNEAWDEIHMMPSETVQAGIDLKADTILAIHNSKFVLALHPWDEPLRHVTQSGEEMNQSVITPLIGQSFVLGDEYPSYPWWEDVEQAHAPTPASTLVNILLPTVAIAGVVAIRRYADDSRANDETDSSEEE